MKKMTIEEAEKFLTQENRPRAVVYALTVLLVKQRIISSEDLEALIIDWAEKQKAIDDKFMEDNPFLGAIMGQKR